MAKRFQGKVALITGASSGIGRSTAELFSREGAKVAIVGRNKERLQETKKICEKAGGKNVLVIAADLMKFESLYDIVDKTVKEFGQLDVLVNNAGLAKVDIGTGITLENFDIQMNTNVRAPMFITQRALPHLEKTKGNIVNISSAAALMSSPESLVYTFTKAGLDHYSRSLSSLCALKGVRVNVINPGATVTGFIDELVPDKNTRDQVWQSFGKTQPLGVMQPTDIAMAIAFLASDNARFITGVNLPVEGGRIHARQILDVKAE